MILSEETSLLDGLNDAQKQAVSNSLSTCTKIVAGAGTGKTKIISKRFVKLVLDLMQAGIENPASKLLVITFTDKAANEMKERILKELEANRIDCSVGDLWISTFHGFCSRILKKHSIEANLSPFFKLGSEDNLKEIYDNVVKKIKYSETSSIADFENLCIALGLNKDTLSVQNLSRLSKIGDLDEIFEDIFSLIKKIKSLGLLPSEFLKKAVESTSSYCRTLEKIKVGFSSKNEYIDHWQSCLKSYCDDFCVFEDDEGNGAFKGLSKVLISKNGSRKPSAWTYVSGFPEDLAKIEKEELNFVQISALIYAIYQNELERLDIIDFDDLINKTAFVFKNNFAIADFYRNYFQHLIIDEFQDTNGAQLELIRLLLKKESPNLTFVGDRKQSIYGFRFAQMENLEVLHDYVQKKYGQKFEEIKLEINYRSTPNVLNEVNYLTLRSLKLDECLSAHKEPEDNMVKSAVLCDCKGAYDHRMREADYIAQEILRLKKTHDAQYKDFAVLLKSHAQADMIDEVLSKAEIPCIKKVNTSFFESTEIKNVIALFRLAQNSFDERSFIKILSINLCDSELYSLKKELDSLILSNNGDFDSLKKMNFCEKILFLKNHSLYEHLDVDNSIKSCLDSILEALEFISLNRARLSLLQIFYRLINTVCPYVEQDEISQMKAEQNLKIFEKILSDFMQSNGTVSLRAFTDYILKISKDRSFELPSVSSKEINAVSLLTIHASKGLEFPFVFVCSLKQGASKSSGNVSFDLQYGNKPGFGVIFNKFEGQPTLKAGVYKEIWKKPRECSEDLRLFYVALSRAQRYLNVLSFESYSNVKPAFYCCDISSGVLKENINNIDNM